MARRLAILPQGPRSPAGLTVQGLIGDGHRAIGMRGTEG